MVDQAVQPENQIVEVGAVPGVGGEQRLLRPHGTGFHAEGGTTGIPRIVVQRAAGPAACDEVPAVVVARQVVFIDHRHQRNHFDVRCEGPVIVRRVGIQQHMIRVDDHVIGWILKFERHLHSTAAKWRNRCLVFVELRFLLRAKDRDADTLSTPLRPTEFERRGFVVLARLSKDDRNLVAVASASELESSWPESSQSLVIHFHCLDRPVRQPAAVDPVVEERLPNLAGVVVEFGFQLRRTEYLPRVLAHEIADEVVEVGLAHAGFHQAEHLRATVVRPGEEAEKVPELRQRADGRFHLVAADRPHHRAEAVVLPLHAGCERYVVPGDDGVVLAACRVQHLVREEGCRTFIHEGLAVAVGAHEVVPPLVAGLVAHQILDVAVARLGHVEHTLVDHRQAGGFVAVPAEVALDNRVLPGREIPEPAGEARDRLRHRVQDHLGPELMPLEGQALELDLLPAVRLGDMGVFVELRTAHQCEVPTGEGQDGGNPFAVLLFFRGNRRTARQLLFLGQLDGAGVDARFVPERLMPRHERHGVPTEMVVVRHRGQRVCQDVHTLPVAPAALLVGQADRAVDGDCDAFAGSHQLRQGDAHRCRVGLGVLVGQLDHATGRVGHGDGVDLSRRRRSRQHGIGGVEPQHFQRLRQHQFVGLGHRVARVEVDHQFLRVAVGRVRPGDPLADVHQLGVGIQVDGEFVARQVGWHRSLCNAHHQQQSDPHPAHDHPSKDACG